MPAKPCRPKAKKCKCGSKTHQRANHRECPLNPKKKAAQESKDDSEEDESKAEDKAEETQSEEEEEEDIKEESQASLTNEISHMYV